MTINPFFSYFSGSLYNNQHHVPNPVGWAPCGPGPGAPDKGVALGGRPPRVGQGPPPPPPGVARSRRGRRGGGWPRPRPPTWPSVAAPRSAATKASASPTSKVAARWGPGCGPAGPRQAAGGLHLEIEIWNAMEIGQLSQPLIISNKQQVIVSFDLERN